MRDLARYAVPSDLWCILPFRQVFGVLNESPRCSYAAGLAFYDLVQVKRASQLLDKVYHLLYAFICGEHGAWVATEIVYRGGTKRKVQTHVPAGLTLFCSFHHPRAQRVVVHWPSNVEPDHIGLRGRRRLLGLRVWFA